MVAPAIPLIVGAGAWAYRLYRGYRAVQASSRVAQVAATAERARKAAQLAKAAEQAQQLSQSKAREEPCDDCAKIVPCFNKPDGMKDDEFERQLKEQQDTINNTTADKILERRQAIRDAGGTDGVRDLKAQRDARQKYLDRAPERGQSMAEAEKAMRTLDATHALDIIAGGDPAQITGLFDRSVNRSLGGQWKGSRSQALEDEAKRMHDEGQGKEKMKVKLEEC